MSNKERNPALRQTDVSSSVLVNDLFATELIEQPKISKDEFVEKAKLILEKIWSEYIQSFEKPLMSEEEIEAAPCEKCNGCMNWRYFDEEIQCVQDRIEGDCRKVALNTEVFASLVEHTCQSDDFQMLIGSDVI